MKRVKCENHFRILVGLTRAADTGRIEENGAAVAIFDAALLVALGLGQAGSDVIVTSCALGARYGEQARERRKTG